MIVADNLHKAFDTRTGRIQAVSNVGFRAEDGRIVLWDDAFGWGSFLASSVAGLGRLALRR